MPTQLIKGNLQSTYTVVSTATDLALSDYVEIVICNSSSGIILALPPATGSGKSYNIKLTNTGPVTVSGYSTDTIDGYNTKIIDTIYDNLTIVDGGSGTWYIL